jgi:hypothetical protein
MLHEKNSIISVLQDRNPALNKMTNKASNIPTSFSLAIKIASMSAIILKRSGERGSPWGNPFFGNNGQCRH